LHGEAIAAGMVLESFISLHKNLINQEEYFQIKSTIKSIYGI
jgi:3-dehydroquinate synthase